jgi:hypothetical protein
MSGEVQTWLFSIGLGEYLTKLEEAGYDDMYILAHLEAEDLQYLNITKPGHKKRFLYPHLCTE